MGTFFRAESLLRLWVARAMMRERCTELPFLHALILFYGFGRDSGGVSAGGVGLLDVGSRGGDGAPRLAGLIADGNGTKR